MADGFPAPEPLSAFVARARELYTLPAAAMKVLELTAAATVDARALKSCIETDPALTAKLLRVVNSSLFGLSRQVSDLNQALALLGVKPLKLLVLGFSLPKALFEGLEARTLAAYWRRTLTKAAAARELSQAAFGKGSDEAFIAGLLQDLGQLALVQDLGPPYIAFLERARHEASDLASCELAVLGFDHAMLSARLLDQWGLPATLVEALAARQDVTYLATLASPGRQLAQALHLAELAARVLADGQSQSLEALHHAAATYANLSTAQVDQLLRRLEETVALLAEALDLELSDAVDCERLLVEAQAQRAEIACAAASDLEQAAQETMLWQEVETLRRTTEQFLSRGTEPWPPGGGVRSPQPGAPPQADAYHRELGLWNYIELAVNQCRQRRAAVSLLAVAIDDEQHLALTAGPEGLRRALQLIAAAAPSLWDASLLRVDVGQTTVAIIVEDCDRPQAVDLARRLVETVGRCAAAKREWFGHSFTIRVGAATLALPPRNFPPHELIEAAWRCLSAARAAGGNVVKSIDIY